MPTKKRSATTTTKPSPSPSQPLVVLTTRIRGASRIGFWGPMSWVDQLVVPALAKK